MEQTFAIGLTNGWSLNIINTHKTHLTPPLKAIRLLPTIYSQ